MIDIPYISVKDSLPPLRERCLILVHRQWHFGHRAQSKGAGWYWVLGTAHYRQSAVTHWAPAPRNPESR